MNILTVGAGTVLLLIGGDLLFAVGMLSWRDLRKLRRQRWAR
jgi:hypothetical protein